MMKRIALFVALAVLPMSCVVRNDDPAGYARRFTRAESMRLFTEYVANPVNVLDILLECTDFMRASEEERKEDRFDDCRENLFFSHNGSCRFGDLISFSVGTKPLDSLGGRSAVEYTLSPEWSNRKVSCIIECIEDGSKWDLVIDDGIVVHCERSGESVYKVSVSGKLKANDGYDLAFALDDGFTVGLDENRNPVPDGVLRHTVSDGTGQILSCVSSWEDGEDMTCVITDR